MAPDLIVYGVVAAGLVFWLRSLLGTRHGEERERPNPYSPENFEKAQEMLETLSAADENNKISAEDRIRELGLETKGIIAIENKTAENNVIRIAQHDKNFDIDFFFDAVQDVFVMIVKAFAAGRREDLEDLLSAPVFKAFDSAITERESTGYTIETDIHVIRKAEIIKADLEQDTARITVRFKADETRVERDNSGNVVTGDPDKVSQMIDIWTFSRDLAGEDPRWLLVQTSSEGDDDNDLVPDA